MQAEAYVNHDRVVVDCPYGCGTAYKVLKTTKTIECEERKGGCGQTYEVRVAQEMADILTELRKRPDKANRNWFPSEHPFALKSKQPHGQSVSDLRAEHRMMSEQEW